MGSGNQWTDEESWYEACLRAQTNAYDKAVHALRDLPSGLFSVKDLMFLQDPTPQRGWSRSYSDSAREKIRILLERHRLPSLIPSLDKSDRELEQARKEMYSS